MSNLIKSLCQSKSIPTTGSFVLSPISAALLTLNSASLVPLCARNQNCISANCSSRPSWSHRLIMMA
eukprot:12893048-Prorocentrum_lima.AAC.1